MFVPCSSHPVEQELLPALPVPLGVIWGSQQSRTVLRNPFCSWGGAWELLRAEAWGHLCKSPSWLTLGFGPAEKHRAGSTLSQRNSKRGAAFCNYFHVCWMQSWYLTLLLQLGAIRVAPSRVSFCTFPSQMKLNCWERQIRTKTGCSQTYLGCA